MTVAPLISLEKVLGTFRQIIPLNDWKIMLSICPVLLGWSQQDFNWFLVLFVFASVIPLHAIQNTVSYHSLILTADASKQRMLFYNHAVYLFLKIRFTIDIVKVLTLQSV